MNITFQILFTAFLSVLVLVLSLFRAYKKYVAPYTVFPTSWAVFKIVLCTITGKLPKGIERASYIFRLLRDDCIAHMSEGFCVLWLPRPLLLVFNEEAVKILSNEQLAINKPYLYDIIEEGFGYGIVTSNGQEWRHRRKLFQPSFQMSVVKDYTPVFNENADILVQRLMKVMDEPVEIIRYLRHSSIDNIASTIMGFDASGVEKLKIAHIVDTAGHLLALKALNPLLQWNLTKHFFPVHRQFAKCITDGNAVSAKLLLEMKDAVLRKKNCEQTSQEQNYYQPVKRNFAEVLVQTHIQDPSFTLENMTSEFKTVVVGGYDSVAYGMMWCLFLLGNYPEIQEQLYNEVEHLKGKEISYEDIKDLTYLDCVMKETLRLYPVVPLYMRCVERDVQCGKHVIPSGTNIVFFPFVLHRNPEVYPNPDKFDPERFRDNHKNPWSHTPFSEGIRSCIGKNFALLQMKITVAIFVLNFYVTSMKRVEEIEPAWEIVAAPNQPVMLRLAPRCPVSDTPSS